MKNPFEQLLKKHPFAKKTKISWGEFVVLAAEASKLYKFPPNITICQAALECGRGTSLIARTKNNYFGFMAYDQEPWKAKKYVTALNSIIDYLELVTKNPRYAEVNSCKTSEQKIEAIWEAGYASDPEYVEKILALREWRM